jgi:hypothetical protein
MHEYTVSLLIRGENLNPDKITEDLNLEPSLTRRSGERRSKIATYHGGVWSYDGSNEPDGYTHWETLEDGLMFLFDRLTPVKDRIDKYKSEFELTLWCGHFQSAFNGGPGFSPELLQKLADFGVKLYIDTYFREEKNDDA